MRALKVLTVVTYIFVFILQESDSVFIGAPGVEYVQSGKPVSFIWNFDISLDNAIIHIRYNATSDYIISSVDNDMETSDKRYIPFKNETSVGFTLQEVTDSDGGRTFQCSAFYAGKSYKKDGAAIVIDRAPKNINVMQNPETVSEGIDVLLTCSAQGNSIPPNMSRDVVYTWYAGDRVVSTDDRHSFLDQGTKAKLLIKDLRTTDGPYICRAQEIGSTSSSEISHQLYVQTTASPYSKPQHHASTLSADSVTDGGTDEHVISDGNDTQVASPAASPHSEPTAESGLGHFLRYGLGPLAAAVLLLILIIILAKFTSVNKSKRKRETRRENSVIHTVTASTDQPTDPGASVQSADTIRSNDGNNEGHHVNRQTSATIDHVYAAIHDNDILSGESLMKSEAPHVPARPATSLPPGSQNLTGLPQDADPYLKATDRSITGSETGLLYNNQSPLTSPRNERNPGMPAVDMYLTTCEASLATDEDYNPTYAEDATANARIRQRHDSETNPKQRLDSETIPKQVETSPKKMAVQNVYTKQKSEQSQESSSDCPTTRSPQSEYLQMSWDGSDL